MNICFLLLLCKVSFNRYMVECELWTYNISPGKLAGFNRYMVECELEQYRKEFELKMVLIDTWWNVNERMLVRFEVLLTVLIDTWWNVNSVFLQRVVYQSRFNRYMVECESERISRQSIIFTVLIDTWWNVNVEVSGMVASVSLF